MPVGYLAGSFTWSVLDATADLAIFSGVLAAFVFLAMVDYAKPDRLKNEQPTSNADQQLPLMVGAFFSFVVAAFLFAILHGDLYQASVNPFAQAICPSVVLGIGVVQLAVSLSIGLNEQSAAFRAAKWVAYATIMIAVVFLTGIVVSPFFQLRDQAQINPPFGWDSWWLWAASILLIGAPYGIARFSRLADRFVSVCASRWATTWLCRLPATFRPEHFVEEVRNGHCQHYLQVQLSIAIGVAAAVVQNILTSVDVLPAYRGWTADVSLAVVLVIVGMPLAALALEVGGIEESAV